ncbi:MAG: nitrous oxide reductase accessory protein NosL [Wolinella sp.]
MKTILLLLFGFGTLLAEISAIDVDSWLGDSNATCQIKYIDTKKYPKWRAVIVYKDGKKELFSSPKSMLHYFYSKSYQNFSGVKNLYVSDYNSGDLILASDAFYVFGSRIVSMSGDDLIPFSTKESAEKFSQQWSGKRIFEFSNITKKLIDYLEM